MEEMLNDKRFAHIAKDPKFRRIPKSERKVKIDKRFQAMFKDKKFTVKYTVDKRGRPVSQTSTENLKKYYDISSSEEDSSNEESDSTIQDDKTKKNDFKKKSKQLKIKKDNIKDSKNKIKGSKNKKNKKNEVEESEGSEADDNDVENFSSNGSLLLIKKHDESTSDSENEKESENEESDIENELEENERQLNIRKGNKKKLDSNTKKKLTDLSIDYARGEGVLLSDSSSDEESSEYEDEVDIEHNWGELDKEAETTNEITHRLALCNMDWDRIKATDLMVLFNSFLPTGGLINKITIYPSEFGLQRMKEEEVKGPTELVALKQKDYDDNEDVASTSENEEGSSYHMEKLRQYQLNRLKYYYAVIVFDSANTANKVYTECDGLEYESSSTKLDLRFIPDDMSFDHEPREVCDKLPDLTKYTPRQFTTSALQQVKVDLTWDETDPDRIEITQKLNSGKLDEIDKNDMQAYLASGTSEDEAEDEVKKQLEGIDESDSNVNPIDKYKSLLKSIEQAEEEKKNKEVELEFTWGLGVKEKSEKLIKEKMKQKENLTPFEQYLDKRKSKKIAKREQKKNKSNDENKSDSEDSVPSDIDMNDPYFAEELQNTKPKTKKRKNTSKNSDLDSADEEEEKRRQAELELLLMDENDESNKHHFSMKRIEEAESLTKSKKKRLSKKKKELKEEASKDEFKVDVNDTRFGALYTSHHYNIDPADPHFRKTKGTEALITEKLKRRTKNDTIPATMQENLSEEKNKTDSKINAELSSLVKTIKRNAQNLKKKE